MSEHLIIVFSISLFWACAFITALPGLHPVHKQQWKGA